MKVLLFSGSWPEYMIELANSVSKHCTTLLMIPDNHRFTGQHKRLIAREVIFEPYQIVFHKSLRDNFRMLWKILLVIWKFKPDVLHIQSNGHRMFFWVCILKPWNTKVVNTVHDPVKHLGDEPSNAINDDLNVSICRFFTSRYIVHGRFLREQLTESYRVPPGKIEVIPHGHFEIYKRFQKEHAEESSNTVLFFGRIWKYKGLKYFIEAGNLLVDQNPNVQILIVGKGEDLSDYRKMIKHDSNFTIINERVAMEAAGCFFEKATVVVLPYIEATQSGVIPVAYAYGKPVVATRVGSIPEVVQDGLTGFLVPPKDPKQIAEKVYAILEDSKLRNRMKANAYSYAMNELSWITIGAKTFQLYLEVQ